MRLCMCTSRVMRVPRLHIATPVDVGNLRFNPGRWDQQWMSKAPVVWKQKYRDPPRESELEPTNIFTNLDVRSKRKQGRFDVAVSAAVSAAVRGLATESQ